MKRDVRQLVGLYFLFVIFLFAASAEEARPPVPVAAARLAAAAKPDQDRLRTVMAAVLREAGFSLTRPSDLNPFAFAPRAESKALIWTAPAAGEARAILTRTVAALAAASSRHAGRVASMQWTLRAGYLSLDVFFAQADGSGMELRLRAPLIRDNHLGMVRRTALPAVHGAAGGVRLTVPKKKPADRPRVAIVLDDVGVVAGTEAFLALPAQLTIAVLPLTPYADVYAKQAVTAGRTVILHLPLEALDRRQNPGPGLIRLGATSAEIRAQLEEDLRSVPGAVGVNNHMGSRGTTDAPLMHEILAELKQKGLFFLDSRTFDANVKMSVVGKIAREIGERYAERDLFLDPDGASVAEIQALLRKLIAKARENGSAVGICHANRPHTLAALAATLPDFAAAGVEIVPLNELVHY